MTESRSFLRDFAASSGSLGASSAVVRATGIGLLAAVVRRGGTAAAGYYGIATLLATLAAFAFSLGLGTYCTRGFASAEIPGSEIAALHRLRGAAMAVACALLVAGSGLVAPSYRVGFVLTAVSVLVDQWNETGWAIGRGLGRATVEASANLVSNGALLLAAIGAVAVAGGLRFDLAGALLTCAALGRSVVALRLVGAFPRIPWSASLDVLRRHVRAALAYSASDLLGLAYLRGDTLVLALFASSTVVGTYVAANAFIGPLVQVAATMSLGSLALVARRDRRGGATRSPTSAASEDAALAGLFAAIGTAVACALVLGLWPVVAVLFSSQVGTIRNLGVVLALFLPLRFLNFAFSALLVARGGAGRRLWIVGGTTVLNVALNLLLDGRLGAYGAAWATVVTEVGVTILFVAALRGVRIGAPAAVIGATMTLASVWAAMALRAGAAPDLLVGPIAGVLSVGGGVCAWLSRRALRPGRGAVLAMGLA